MPSHGTLAVIIMRNLKKNTFLVLLLLQSFFLIAQKFDKNYFIKTYWYINNNSNEFNKSDTLRLIKHLKFAPEWSGKESDYAENEKRNLGLGQLVELRFKKRNELYIDWRLPHAMYQCVIKPWKWKYKKKDSTITIYDEEKKVVIKFKPLFEKQIEVYSEFEKKMIKTIELTVLRI